MNVPEVADRFDPETRPKPVLLYLLEPENVASLHRRTLYLPVAELEQFL